MWETRHGFPQPARSERGHRRYEPGEVERVRRVVADREAGMTLSLAIRRTREQRQPADVSLYSELRRLGSALEPHLLSKLAMEGLSTAIEDECLARAERPLLFAAFQREQFYRSAERRWRELARTAQASFVFADFKRARRGRGGPVQVPLGAGSPMIREWSVVCWDERFAACLVGWERPERRRVPDRARRFEAVWTLEPEAVRQAAALCTRQVGLVYPQLGEDAGQRLGAVGGPSASLQLKAAATLTARMAEYLDLTPSRRP